MQRTKLPRWRDERGGIRSGVVIAATLTLLAVGTIPGFASHPEVSLPGSNFEIDSDANLKVDDPAPSIDWANVADTKKNDEPTGATDDSFGQGSKEDTAVPTVVDGSIPPNKSDLRTFGLYQEVNADGRFLHLFWTRVQDPSGTTNMDFELNQSSTASANGVTPVRTAGDLLITYDLSRGGTVPSLSLREWDGTQWGPETNLTASGDATGSINTSSIPGAEADGLAGFDPRTFGEASVDLDAILDPTKCQAFGSAYLKSRSSDSFTAALKDFIAPAPVNITNCGTVIIRKVTDPASDPDAITFGYTKAFPTDPASSNTFTLGDGRSKTFNNVLFGTGYTVTEDSLPAGWDFVSVDCSASTGVTPSINGTTVTFDIDVATDVLDCTYTNRARGTIIVEKITDDGSGSFGFTSGTLTPSPFTLTTTAAGSGGKDARTFSDLTPGTYDVAETVPAGWNLVSSTCDDGSDPASIGLSAGETVTCTFHDARETGAILITKTRKHAADGPGDHPHAGVTFTVTGGELPAAGVTAVTNAQGQACFDGLVVSGFVGNYTVTETVPNGYEADGDTAKTVTVSTESGCGDGNEATVGFSNTPLTDLSVSVDSQVDGGTSSDIECVEGEDSLGTAGPGGDISLDLEDLPPGTYTCTVVIDP